MEQLRDPNVLRLLIRGHEHTLNEMKEEKKCNFPDISRREQMELRMRWKIHDWKNDIWREKKSLKLQES